MRTIENVVEVIRQESKTVRNASHRRLERWTSVRSSVYDKLGQIRDDYYSTRHANSRI